MEREDLLRRIEDIAVYLHVEEKRARIQEIEREATRSDFWDDPQRAQQLMAELSLLKKVVEEYEALRQRVEDLEVLEEMLQEDPTLEAEVERERAEIVKTMENLEIRAMLNRPEDRHNAILTINPGAGGTESMDWAQMLLRMYLRWAERWGYKTRVLDLIPGEEAGIKHASVLVEGPYAYGYLKAEKGVHRLVRISPFDANQRRHTSFASVWVTPEMPDVEVEINPKDLRIDTFRSSGPGGQHMQKNETAVRIVHIPTGITVAVQSERSQHQNKELALRILKARLYEHYRQEREKQLQALEGEKSDIAWGHQIRSYVLHPYRLVKDHRTGVEIPQADRVLDGEIDEFIRAWLRMQAEKEAR